MTCYQPSKQTRAMVVLVPKFYDIPGRLLAEHFLGNALRDTLRLRTYSYHVFLTDGGERIWRWSEFPANRETPMDWEKFLEIWGEEWDVWAVTPEGKVEVMIPQVEAPGEGDGDDSASSSGDDPLTPGELWRDRCFEHVKV